MSAAPGVGKSIVTVDVPGTASLKDMEALVFWALRERGCRMLGSTWMRQCARAMAGAGTGARKGYAAETRRRSVEVRQVGSYSTAMIGLKLIREELSRVSGN